MDRLTVEEIRTILAALAKAHCKDGRGYSDDPVVGKLQAKLSIMLEVAARMESR